MSRNPHQRLPFGRHQHPQPHPQQQPQQQQQQQQQHQQQHHHQQQHQHHRQFQHTQPRQLQPHQHQHQHQHQHPIPSIPPPTFPPHSQHTLPNIHQPHPMTSMPHNIQILTRPPDPTPTQVHHVSSGPEIAMLEALTAQNPQNQPLYSDPQDLPHSNVPHPAFPGSTTQHPQLTDVYTHQPIQARSQYHPPIWQHEPQHIQSHPSHPQTGISSQRPQSAYQPQVPKYLPTPPASRTAPLKRQRPIDPVPLSHPTRPATAPISPKHPTPGASTDTRVGKERVQRPCANCGQMNHIRKNKCSRCDAPKEPAKKRTKRQRKKKTAALPEHAAAGQTSGPVAMSHRHGMVPDLNQIAVNRAEPLAERQDTRQEAVQPVFDPRSLTFPQGPQTHVSSTVQTQSSRPAQRGQRSAQDFPVEAPFDDNQGNYSQP